MRNAMDTTGGYWAFYLSLLETDWSPLQGSSSHLHSSELLNRSHAARRTSWQSTESGKAEPRGLTTELFTICPGRHWIQSFSARTFSKDDKGYLCFVLRAAEVITALQRQNEANAPHSWNGHCLCTMASELRKTLWFLVSTILLYLSSDDKTHVSDVERTFLLITDTEEDQNSGGLHSYITVKIRRKIT